MAIKPRNTRNLSFNMASMTDLVFLLLIFFMLISTLVAPSAIDLLLPESEGRTRDQETIRVSINENNDYFVNGNPVDMDGLKSGLVNGLDKQIDASVVLESDRTVSVQHIVNVINVVNDINKSNNTKHQVILATQPPG